MNEAGREFNGRSVDEAVASGLQTLGLRSNQVRVEIIHKGSRGLLGIGSTPALVRLVPIQAPEPIAKVPVQEEPKAVVEAHVSSPTIEPVTLQQVQAESILAGPILTGETDSTPLATLQTEADITETEATQTETIAAEIIATETLTTETAATEISDQKIAIAKKESAEIDAYDERYDEISTEEAAIDMLSTLVSIMGFKVSIEPVWKDGDDEHDKRVLWLEIHGNNLSSLIGRRGETLENLQYLLRMMVNQRLHRWNDIVVDVDQYRTRRAEQLAQLAQRLAEQALSAGRAMSLEPMPPNERRIVHMALRDHPNVYTQSSGDGERRKVYIVPKS